MCNQPSALQKVASTKKYLYVIAEAASNFQKVDLVLYTTLYYASRNEFTSITVLNNSSIIFKIRNDNEITEVDNTASCPKTGCSE